MSRRKSMICVIWYVWEYTTLNNIGAKAKSVFPRETRIHWNRRGKQCKYNITLTTVVSPLSSLTPILFAGTVTFFSPLWVHQVFNEKVFVMLSDETGLVFRRLIERPFIAARLKWVMCGARTYVRVLCNAYRDISLLFSSSALGSRGRERGVFEAVGTSRKGKTKNEK